MKVNIVNEYDPLDYVLMAYPQNFDIKEVINAMQRKYIGQINHKLANQQYNAFINTLIDHGVKVQLLNLIDSPEQVYTRDIGFSIHDTLFVSTMAKNIRKEEPSALIEYIEDHEIHIHEMGNTAEGGDVFVHGNLVFVGKSRRTTEEGIEEIRSVLKEKNPQMEVIPIDFNVDQLHLDCVFNILDKDTCILTDQVYTPERIEPHFKRIIRVTGRDVEYLATNFVHLGNGTMVCTNKTMTGILQKEGYNPIYLPYSEFIKSGGSVRCSTMPINRLHP